jgi:hypothetical protein
MERHQIIEAMTGLKLYGMRANFDEIAGKGLNRREELYPLLASLIRAEVTHRQSRSINYRISGARFPVLKDLGAFVFEDTPVDEGQIRELAGGDFIEAKRNLILIGARAQAKPIWRSPSPRRSSARGREAASSTSSISSISSNRKRRRERADASSRLCCATISS